MDIGIGLPTTVPGVGGAELVEFARRADRRGFRTLAALDRFDYDSYDNLTALAAAAAVTGRIRLATTVLLAAYRPGVAEVAKQLATVDRLSGGRLVVGVAAGGRLDDFEANGMEYGTRGRRLDELLDRLPLIWSGEEGGGPRPERGGIPFWVGGHSEAALRRAAKYGEAWIAPGGSVAGYPDLLARAEKVFAEAGRADRPRMVSLAYFALGEGSRSRGSEYLRHYYSHVGPKAELLSQAILSDPGSVLKVVAGYAEAGCDELILFPGNGDPDEVDRLADVVLP